MGVLSVPTRPSDPHHATCNYPKCAFVNTRANVIYHEAEEHVRIRFFCGDCPKHLSSFESLRTHANSQHYRSRVFRCEVCSSTYLDPARLAKCRKRHRGQFRCPARGCKYHNARMNSVYRHITAQHKHDGLGTPVWDDSLGSSEPPRPRRGAGRSVTNNPAFMQGPTDDELFRRSEVIRKERMASARREHAEWCGGEDALVAQVPNYPSWHPRDHPYGRVTPPDGLLTTRAVHAESPSARVGAPSKSWSTSTAATAASLAFDSGNLTPPTLSVPVPAPHTLGGSTLPWLMQNVIPLVQSQYYYDPTIDCTPFLSSSNSPTETVLDEVVLSPLADGTVLPGASFGNTGDASDPLQEFLSSAPGSFSSDGSVSFVGTSLSNHPYEGWSNLWERVG